MTRSESRTTVRDTRSLESLARSFLEFAAAECSDEPVYDALCRIAAANPRILTLLWGAPLAQQKPNLLLASIHDLVLGDVAHPFCDYFPSASGTSNVDADLEGRFLDFVAAFERELRGRIATRATQTNEVGRCAVLEPCLAHLAATRGVDRIAFLDFGTSAGLNLSVDSYRYDYGGFTRGATSSPQSLLVPCELRSASVPRGAALPSIVTRLGIDREPIDVRDDVAVRWLRACIWPNDRARAERFAGAVAAARTNAHPVRREVDDVAAIERWLASAPSDALRVVFHSWVLFYFEPAARERFGLAMEALVRRYDAVWLSAEAESLVIGRRAPAPRGATPGATAWIACSRDGEGVRDELLARSHPHGKWLEWIAEEHAESR